jgi:hypothetical protein
VSLITTSPVCEMVSDIHLVESLTITFMPMTGEINVIVRVIAAMTAKRSQRWSSCNSLRTVELGNTDQKP